MGDTRLSLGNRKLVVLGIPWDIDTEGLKKYMSKYGTLDDVVVMKERGTGRSRGFGYVTFSSSESAEKALATQHIVNGRLLEVKVATPKEDMKTPSKKVTRIFVARIPAKVSEETFRRYFEKFGAITDIYMPKDQGAKSHRGIGFITFENSDSVDRVMAETHDIAGSTVAVDRATPKEEPAKYSGKGYSGEKGFYGERGFTSDRGFSGERGYSGAYGAYSPYIAASGFGGFGMPSLGTYDYSATAAASEFGPAGFASGYRGSSWPVPPPPNSGPQVGGPGSGRSAGFSSGSQPDSKGRSIGNRIFVGRLPSEATADDLRRYFSNFGRILDVFVPKDSKKSGHRGFGFITFADEGPARRVSLRSHELLGHEIAVELATPQNEAQMDSEFLGSGPAVAVPNIGTTLRGTGSSYPGSNFSAGLDYNNGWSLYGASGVGPIMASDRGPSGGSRPSRMESRYRPY